MLDALAGNETLWWSVAAISVLTFLGSLVLVPWLVVRIPRDYFVHEERRKPLCAHCHPVVRLCLLAAKNVVGGVLLVAGILMLVLPGQGLITMLIALMLIDFPGKFRAERWVVEREPVFRAINWLRQRSGRPPLALSDD